MLINYTFRTQVTANQVVITASQDKPSSNGDGATVINSPAIVHGEVSATNLDTPTPSVAQAGTTPQAAQNTEAASSPNIAGAIAGVLVPTGSGSNGGSESQGGGNSAGGGSGGGAATGAGPGTRVGAPTAGGSGGSATGIAIVPLPESNGGSGSGNNIPSPLVLTIGGKPTTIAATVIPGAMGSVTAFIVGPGSTIVEGGVALTLSDTTISLPAPSKTGSGTASAASTGTITSTGDIGGAIASGLGYTSPAQVTTSFARKTSIDLSLFCATAFLSVIFGGLTVWL
jgi:hypothetical protein